MKWSFRRSRLVRLTILSASVTGFASAIPLHAASTQIAYVRIVGFDYEPRILTVPPGTTVTWTSPFSGQHTTTSVIGLWDSGLLLIDATFSVQFIEEGTYPYACNIHSDMRGTITMDANAPQPTEPAWLSDTVTPADRSGAALNTAAPPPLTTSPTQQTKGDSAPIIIGGVLLLLVSATALPAIALLRRRARK